MTAPVRLGLVGAGRLAQVGYVPAASAARHVVIAAVADPDLLRGGLVAARAGGVPVFADATALLAGSDVDALVLASPAAAHVADATAAVAAGVPVLVEKPPAPDRAGAEALAALDPAPYVAFNRRFDPAVAAVRAAVAPGAEVGLFLEIGYRRGGWAPHTVADDALLDLGPHLVDLARWITGAEVDDVRRVTVTPTHAAFDLVLGAARARVRCATDRMHHERVEVRRRDGTPVAHHRVGGLVGAVLGRPPSGRPHPLVASLTAELEAFARTVRGTPDPVLGTAADGAAVLAVIDEVRARALSDEAHQSEV